MHTHLPDKSLLILSFGSLKSVLREVFDLLKQANKRRIILGDALLLPDSLPGAYGAALV